MLESYILNLLSNRVLSVCIPPVLELVSGTDSFSCASKQGVCVTDVLNHTAAGDRRFINQVLGCINMDCYYQ